MRLRVIFLTVLATALFATIGWAARNYSTSGRWIATGDIAMPESDAHITPTSWTFSTDGTGDGEFTVPEGSIGADEASIATDTVILCGQADENGTIYLGPATAVYGGDGSASYAVGSAGCDALDNATEATADAPILTNTAFKIMGGVCKTDGTLGASETLAFTVRSAAADTTPQQTCSLAAGESDCSITTATTTDVAAGATIAIKAVQVSNNADDNLWCRLTIAYQ